MNRWRLERFLAVVWLAGAAAVQGQGMAASAPAMVSASDVAVSASASAASEPAASAPLAGASTLSTAPPTSDPSAEEAHRALRELKSRMEKALAEMDIDTLLANVTEDVVFTTMNGDVAHGRDGIRKYFETMMKGPDRVVSHIDAHFDADEVSRLYGSDLAIAYGSSNDRYEMTKGGSLFVAGRWTAAMVRRDGKWLIANFHYSSNMFDNAVLDMQRKWFTIGGVVLAAVLALAGFLIGRSSGRKRAP